VDAAVAAGADALGFVFTPRSKRCLETGLARKLVERVPAFVTRVGLFMDQDIEEIGRVLDTVPLSLLQFHGRESRALCAAFGLPYVKSLAMASAGGAVMAADYPDAAALLLDSHEPGAPGGTGKTFDWASIPPLPRPLVLAGGLTPDNVARAVREVRPWAVDVSSGVERSPGVKSTAKMKAFIKEAKREN
jgi:phosphoribosylanthranilate isomerase